MTYDAKLPSPVFTGFPAVVTDDLPWSASTGMP